jgi:hypothetical protein
MKHYGLIDLTFWASVIVTGLLITSCGAGIQVTSGIDASPAAAKPQLSLNPSAGVPSTQIVVEGNGFPERMRVRIGLSPQDEPQHVTYIGEVDVSESGDFSLRYILPDIWPDGSPMDDDVLTFSAVTLEGQVQASADFQEISSSASALTALASLTSTPVRTPMVTVSSAPRVEENDPDLNLDATRSYATDQALTGTSAPVVDASSPMISDSLKTSVDFLYSLLRDPSGTSSLTYLSQRLQEDIANNWALPTGLGIQPGYNSFEVVLLSKTDNSVLIQATLMYESGDSLRDLTLIKEGDVWRIDQIVAGSR